ncbi:2-amino-4-hydroxy-6-hydroxymethyldihydropteridine diphosphokinase [Alteromonas sediminis]|uniref:2-amino-4-hydroxy-6-hydroxymethyldihydropteridine pyrophosphokinase n=1 Tax=Alteromonas sediminis TaxID=2259342 RepID=A0A3N5XVT3_9ALTE|nr:2-amino-4-hydroxy-6-hydroxymethyldihydropteridine diphosphokinase [Alteromonas sediminis]RPJ64837.1 2-amino-4-hydroxy-6-hydroxymethyldihydropteridine diphosphokinase [Alteromonas sediminis]
MMHEHVFLGLGSNMGNSVRTLQEAVDSLTADEQTHLVALSSFYQSAPMGPQDQPDYINAVCQISTTHSPEALLSLCQRIENQYGRERHPDERWGPRTLDVDILLFGEEAVNTPDLTIPHAGLADREFVLVPLFELVPSLIMPNGQPLAKWVSACSLDGLRRLR